jgi:hypothetical protein
MYDTNIDLVEWEQDVTDRLAWRDKIRNGIVAKEKMFANMSETKCLRTHIRLENSSTARIPCTYCNRIFSAQIGNAFHLKNLHGMWGSPCMVAHTGVKHI